MVVVEVVAMVGSRGRVNPQGTTSERHLPSTIGVQYCTPRTVAGEASWDGDSRHSRMEPSSFTQFGGKRGKMSFSNIAPYRAVRQTSRKSRHLARPLNRPRPAVG